MRVRVGEAERRSGRWPHEIYLLNIFFFHLLLTPAAIVLDIGWYGLLLPLAFSLSVIAATYLKGKRELNWFVMVQWRYASARYRILLLGYLLSAIVFLVAWLITLSIEQQSMQSIMFTVFTRIAVMPTLITVMITAVLEAGAINQIANGEVPDWLAERFPPPSALVVNDPGPSS